LAAVLNVVFVLLVLLFDDLLFDDLRSNGMRQPTIT
jgi:hypothetical protein